MASIKALKENSTNSTELITIINNAVPTRYHSAIKKAIKYMKSEHKGQKRISGESFYYHPLNVAAIAASMGMDTTTILAALLHSVPFHQKTQKPEAILLKIEDDFGKEVANMIKVVGGYSTAIDSESESEMKIQYIVRSSNDLRPIFIKIADRIHDARTIDVLPQKDRVRKARDLLEIYSPLAEYMNQYDVKKEIEEIAFRVLMPKEFEEIESSMDEFGKDAEMALEEVINYLEEKAGALTDQKPTVYGRIKGHYSTYNKMKKERKDRVRDIWDLFAFSIVVNSKEECYKISKYLIQNTDINLSFYDDYIRSPKKNGYKAIHIYTKIPQISDLDLEIQIKTHKMHQYNTYGPASHLSYKYRTPGTKEEQAKYFWVKQIHANLYEYFKKSSQKKSRPIPNDTFSNKIYLFTPELKLIDLPVGSTAVDFAYKIHSNLGNKATEAFVNNTKQDLSIMLRNGDHVEILIDEKKELPDREWLKFVRTKKARDEIENEYKRHLLGKEVDFTHVI